MSKRIKKVNELIKRQLSQLILKEIDFPLGILVTITRLETSADLNQAKVFIGVIPEEQTDRVFRILNREIYELQQKLNKLLKMRPIPKIEFRKEERTKEAARVEELLEEIQSEKKD